MKTVLLAPMATSTPKELPLLPPDDPIPESGPPGYSRSTPDPKHRGASMRHALKPLWLTAEHAEMDVLIIGKFDCVSNVLL